MDAWGRPNPNVNVNVLVDTPPAPYHTCPETIRKGKSLPSPKEELPKETAETAAPDAEATIPVESLHGLLRIGQLATACGKTARAMHLYEELGLLKPVVRSKGGFRLYSRAAIHRVVEPAGGTEPGAELFIPPRQPRVHTGFPAELSSIGRQELPNRAT